MIETLQINQGLAKKVLSIVDAGLVRGLGQPQPGQMCVEAAVNYALGAPHGDHPSCVGIAVRAYKIRLNDAAWSSDKSRTAGMRKLAIAQLGSDTINQREFANIVALKACTVIAPTVIRFAANLPRNKKYKTNWLNHAEQCEKATTLEEGRIACRAYADAAYAAYAADADAADAAADAAAAAAAAADAAAAAAADAAAYAADAAAAAAAYAADAAAAYAAADADAAAAYAADAADAAAVRDSWLNLSAQIGLDALIELKSHGCEFLFLCNEKETA